MILSANNLKSCESNRSASEYSNRNRSPIGVQVQLEFAAFEGLHIAIVVSVSVVKRRVCDLFGLFVVAE